MDNIINTAVNEAESQEALLQAMLDEIVEPSGESLDLLAEETDAPSVLEAAREDGEVIDASETELHAAVAEIESATALTEHYEKQDGEHVEVATSANDKPAEASGKGKKGGKKAAKEKEPKAPRATSVTHKPGDLLMAKLGDKASEYLVFTMQDAELEPDALKMQQDAFIARMNIVDAKDDSYIAMKVKDKVIHLIEWMKKGGELNEVIERAFRVMVRDGKLTSGVKGNLQVDLLSKPYSPGTAASQSNKMFQLFPLLGITVKSKGEMVPNPDSLILAKVTAELGID